MIKTNACKQTLVAESGQSQDLKRDLKKMRLSRKKFIKSISKRHKKFAYRDNLNNFRKPNIAAI